MTNKIELRIIDIWTVGLIAFAIGLVVFLKWAIPLPPSYTAEMVAEYFQQNKNGVIFAGILFMNGGVLSIPFFALLTKYILNMQGVNKVFGYTTLGLASAQLWVFFLPALIWTTAAYRPFRNPEITQALSDLGWFCFNIPVAVTEVLEIVIGIAILLDRSVRPIFPRWMGWFSILMGTANTFNNLCGFFKTGPFTWNGVLGWYLAAVAFFIWLVPMIYYMRVHAKSQ